jgi:protein O-mannosyl-transferase
MLLGLLLASVTLALYWPAAHFDFINYDDPEYIVYNPPVQHGLTRAGLVWAFTTSHAGNWHPLAWISHMADCALFGLNPGGHHLTSLIFHTANVVLLFLLLWQWTGAMWRSALVAALFAWHPLHVESVAWVSERKDVLSAFFWLLTLAAYGRYAKGRKAFYCLALFFFALALLSKPMVVTLPFVLLLLDYWPLQRRMTPGLFLEKIPFLAFAALDCAATLWAQRTAHSVVSLDILPVSSRIANALVSCVLYLWKMLWPVDLALPYSYSHAWTFWPAAGAGLLLLLISAGAILRARRQPWLVVGWLWFLGTLAPVIGLVQVGTQPMADRYSYLPLIGIFIMMAWAFPAACTRSSLLPATVVAGALLFLLAGAEVQLQFWRNSVALFSHTVAVTRNNILAEYNLAEALARQGDAAQAVVHYQKALAIQPNRVEAHYNSQTQAHYNLGLIFRANKQWAEAEAQFRACLRADPDLARAHSNLGVALAALGRGDDALEQFRAAARLEPERGSGQAQLWAALDAAYAEAGRFDEAIVAAQKARAAALAEGRAGLAAGAGKRIESYQTRKP